MVLDFFQCKICGEIRIYAHEILDHIEDKHPDNFTPLLEHVSADKIKWVLKDG